MDYLSAAWTAVYYIAYPILYMLSSILAAFGIITSPLLHLSHYSFYACWYALRLLGKFEASQVKIVIVNTCFMGH